jgi:putative restriction endonuclease
MAHAVLTTSVGSIYDDLPEIRYHFPAAYLNQIKGAEGDWIIYYEPRRSRGGGRLAYFAMARIVKVVPDLDRQDHYYAYMDGYLAFDHAVGFREKNHYFETILQREDGNTSKGAFGRSVRDLPEEEFKAIVRAGFTRELEPWEEMDAAAGGEQEAMLPPCPERPLIEGYVARPFRDQAFRRQVRQAYGNTCAFSGLKLLNGGGRPEVQAAHIRPRGLRDGKPPFGIIEWFSS